MNDVVQSEGLIVGAVQKPDGTLDMSHAMRMTGERKISDPIVDRLRGPLQVNTEREALYSKFQSNVQNEAEKGNLAGWFTELMNTIKSPDQPDVSLEDVTSLEFITDAPELKVLRDRFGFDFDRPYFQLSLGQYRELYQKITGHMGANGCVIKGGPLERNETTKGLTLIIAPSLGPEILHEITHTIDPNERQRSPVDEVLEEFAAHYQETYQPRTFIQTTTQIDSLGNKSTPQTTTREVYATIPHICLTLKDDLYANNYAKHFTSRESYLGRVDEIGKVLQELAKHMRLQDIHRAILNATSFYELGHLQDVLERQKS